MDTYYQNQKIDDDNIISSYHDGYKRIGVKHERKNCY